MVHGTSNCVYAITEKNKYTDIHDKESDKVLDIKRRGYIDHVKVRILTNLVSIPKVEIDTQMLYNGRSSVIKNILWDLHLKLPTMENKLGSVKEGLFMEDLCIGKFYLNVLLHEYLKKYCGVGV